ncbi:hypothetical protein SeMB42_g07465 [Synchytrium endobioticum]|uniref:G-patch domain-containing protein n=1 Tax=Synchytrium endobioticum TaxID=286115 RepID=A0A507C646_9FUNG|nr:hypothetical protein SeMB42_g07465 [Synchytrium endobioticum]TPX40134.1 hypothetical protein SeLEV6574_g06766 [Synchytrium endobioticum]
MGLSEKKKKHRYGPNPQGSRWFQDKTKKGQKMLEKMGWKEGSGLGANEDGIKEHISVKFKSDRIGIGADKRSSENWLENTFAYSELLASLNKKMESGAIASGTDDAVEKSLQAGTTETEDAITESTKAESGRLYHRKKFLRNKTVSKYQAADLCCILGEKLAVATKQDQIKAPPASDMMPPYRSESDDYL